MQIKALLIALFVITALRAHLSAAEQIPPAEYIDPVYCFNLPDPTVIADHDVLYLCATDGEGGC